MLSRMIILMILCSLPVFAHAQLPLQPAVIVDNSVDGPNALRLADLNRDGKLDVVIAAGPDGTGGSISYRPFNPSTSDWDAAVIIDSSFPFALDLAVGDLDRDGDLDVVAVSASGDELAWWENSAGNGSAWIGRTILSGSVMDGAAGVEIGDIDGDGDPDLVVAVGNGDAVRWVQNDGDPSNGGWSPFIINAIPFDDPVGLALVDLNRDGKLDVVASGDDGNEIAWWANDGSPADGVGGDGTSWTFNSVAIGFNRARDVVAGDFDLDGDIDLAAAARSDDELAWWENTAGDGSSWVKRSIGTLDGAERLQALDLDFDGDLDVFASGSDGGEVAWWERTPGGWTRHDIDNAVADAGGLRAGDVDADGDVDLVYASVSLDEVLWAQNDPIHRSVSFVETVVSPDFADTAVAADIDQDGVIDIVGGGSLAWWSRHGGSWIRREIDIFAGIPAGALLAVAVADLDQDGDPDIAGTSSGRVFWWENDGTPADGVGGGLGTSWTRYEVSQGHGSQLPSIEIADLDRDGFLDLVVADQIDNEVLWWRNDGSPTDGLGGDGNSWTEGQVNVTTDPRAAIVRDVDRDGDPDVLVITQFGSASSGRINWWLNDGSGSSWTRQIVSNANTALAVDAGDIDRDGDIDVMSGIGGSGGPGNLDLFRQDAPINASHWTFIDNIGLFDDGQLFPTGTVLGDFDLDGDLDTAASVQFNPEVYWWENPSLSGGWPRQSLERAGNTFVRKLRAQEVDGRGPLDLITASGSDGIAVWENRAAQAELIAIDSSPDEFASASSEELLRISARRLGRSGDNPAEIARLRLQFNDQDDNALSASAANAVFSEVALWQDQDDSGTLDPGIDLFIESTSSLPLDSNGEFDFTLPDFSVDIESGFLDYFLVLSTTADADQQGLDAFRLTLLTPRSRMEDAVYDSPLVLLNPEALTTSIILLEPKISNQSPIARPDSFTAVEDIPFSGNVFLDNGNGVDSDPDGDPIEVPSPGTFTAAGIGGSVTIAANGDFDYTPPLNAFGIATFNYTIVDPSSATDSATVTITVTPVNDPPVADDQTVSTNEDMTVLVLSGSDIEGEALIFSIVDGPTIGTLGAITLLTDTTAEVTYTPNIGADGNDSFTFIVNDGTGDSAEATVTIDIDRDRLFADGFESD